MEYTGNLKNSRILVKDIAKNRVVADTVITDFNPYTNILKIRVSSLMCADKGKVSVLIFQNNRILEFEGRLHRPVIANEVEIALNSGKEKEERKCSRYAVQTEGIVSDIRLCDQMISLRKPIPIETKNISANGVLFQAAAGSFEVGHRIRLMLRLKETVFQNEYKVVRIHSSGLWTEEYGCRMIADRKG